MYYTLGQRRGLGIGGGGDGRRWFVVAKDLSKNELLVEQGEDSPRLYSASARIEDPHWIAGTPPFGETKTPDVHARFRHRQPLQAVTLREEGGGFARAAFHNPQRAITPGQHAVFYRGEACIGGGVVCEAGDGGEERRGI
jgi:tRNA-specific 2-thiouridylase